MEQENQISNENKKTKFPERHSTEFSHINNHNTLFFHRKLRFAWSRATKKLVDRILPFYKLNKKVFEMKFKRRGSLFFNSKLKKQSKCFYAFFYDVALVKKNP